MLHIPPTNYHHLAAKRELYQKAYLSTKNIAEFSGKKLGEWASTQKKVSWCFEPSQPLWVTSGLCRKETRQKEQCEYVELVS